MAYARGVLAHPGSARSAKNRSSFAVVLAMRSLALAMASDIVKAPFSRWTVGLLPAAQGRSRAALRAETRPNGGEKQEIGREEQARRRRRRYMVTSRRGRADELAQWTVHVSY